MILHIRMKNCDKATEMTRNNFQWKSRIVKNETREKRQPSAAAYPLGKRSWKWIISTMTATFSFAAEHRLCLM